MDVLTNQQNTVYARPSYGVQPFEWAGKCASIDRLVKELGSMNPTFCQAESGGLEVTGHTRGTPGLATTTVMFKESTVVGLGDRLMTCLWDLDRRSHCQHLSQWNKWDKIVRVVMGQATSIDEGGSTMNEDEEELITSLPWSAIDRCAIRRVALSLQSTGAGVQA